MYQLYLHIQMEGSLLNSINFFFSWLRKKSNHYNKIYSSVGWNTWVLFFQWSCCPAAGDPLGRRFWHFWWGEDGQHLSPAAGIRSGWQSRNTGKCFQRHRLPSALAPVEKLRSSVGVMGTGSQVKKPLLPREAGKWRNHTLCENRSTIKNGRIRYVLSSSARNGTETRSAEMLC